MSYVAFCQNPGGGGRGGGGGGGDCSMKCLDVCVGGLKLFFFIQGYRDILLLHCIYIFGFTVLLSLFLQFSIFK